MTGYGGTSGGGAGGAEATAWVDREAGPLLRSYLITNGRTEPSYPLELLSEVEATGPPGRRLGPEHDHALRLCQEPIAVAVAASRLGLTVSVTKILLADLIVIGALKAGAAGPAADPTNPALLEVLLHGLRKL